MNARTSSRLSYRRRVLPAFAMLYLTDDPDEEQESRRRSSRHKYAQNRRTRRLARNN
jgi:hypothetical protein